MIDIIKPETKDKVIGVAFTQTDYEIIKQIAEKHKMKVGSYVREYIKKTLLKKKGQ